MQAPSPTRWPVAIVVVHWLTLALWIVAVGAVLAREGLDDPALRRTLMLAHRTAGVLVLLATALRAAVRLRAARPAHNLPALTARLAAAGHAVLYLALLAVPLTGALLSALHDGAVRLLGLTLPSPFARDRDLAELLEPVHTTAAWAMVALVVAHAATALWHHFVRRDQVLRSMTLPGAPPRPH
ncbi:cytochrome b/b6 domain-containing protein [uncultured Aquabacterium sp.]|uniref:cytochrome b n=1 Tax=Aquabacterium sp. TaxID=1872578 RepID=UPI0025FD3897|nr:cytochrome b/b6 domain-containing protein [uncultured Aquabacterium sp.]